MFFKRAVVSLLPYVPKPLIWRVSRRYIAGESLDDALALVGRLNNKGMSATLDVLGEDSTHESEALASRDLYLRAIAAIADQGLDCNVSVKLSQMALRNDETLSRDIAGQLAAATRASNNFLRVDMEDSSVTDVTLDIYRELRRDNREVGTVVQAYLRRTEDDVRALIEAGPTNLRLCKGIYREPEELAYQDREDVRDSYKRLLTLMLESDTVWRVGIATHDAPLVEHARKEIERLSVPPERYEFQMLLGVTERIRDALVATDHPMRIYVPFGVDWFPYSVRRLRENPQIASHVIKGLFYRG